MRKYHQLLLLILSVVSLSLLLVYRHEYNRLHYVLEVFNFFGQPCNLSEIENNNIINHHDWGPPPLFTNDEELYIYSSFWMPTREAKTIVVAKVDKELTAHAKNCYLWYEEKEEPVIGKFKYTKLQRDDKNLLESYHYICSSTNLNTPYAVSYVKNKRNMKKHPLTIDKWKIIFNTTMCLAPSAKMNKAAIVDFISFHTLIGVDSFVVYTNTLPYRLIKLISNLSNQLGIKIAFYEWNFPLTDSSLSRSIVDGDCLLRTINQSKYVTTLHVNEFIVPSKRGPLKDVLTDIKSDRFDLAVQKFCADNINPQKPMPLQNFQTIRDVHNKVQVIYKNNNENGVISESHVDKDLAWVHQYVPCSSNDVHKSYTDKSMLTYSTDFSRSTLVQLLLHKSL